ncbi:hypothetical protein ACTXT7_003638 [Hymenolepis weldensis]
MEIPGANPSPSQRFPEIYLPNFLLNPLILSYKKSDLKCLEFVPLNLATSSINISTAPMN